MLAAAGDQPYTRMTTDRTVAGYQTEQAVAWLGHGPLGRVAYPVGDPHHAARPIADLAARNLLGSVAWVHLPRMNRRALVPHLRPTRQEDVVALGVMLDNVGAARLYRRLGFTGSLARSSAAIG